MLFEIYYMKPDHFRRFIIGDEKPKVSELPETHTLLARALCAIDLGDVIRRTDTDQFFVVSNIGFTLLEDDRPRSGLGVVLDPVTFGKLIKKCAFEMNAFDMVAIDKAHEEGCKFMSRGAAGGPSVNGNRICQETAKGMGLEPFGELAYYLLAYAWNDALDWADRQTGAGYLADLSET